MNPCQTCHAGCCRAFAVPITGADIIRIENSQSLSFSDFVCRWADPKGAIARKRAPHFHFSDEPETPFVICLMHEQSQFLAESTKCRFLIEDPPDTEFPLGVSRCGIYDDRPSTCRTFPTKLDESGLLAVIHHVPKYARSKDNPAYTLCPRPWEPADFVSSDTIEQLVVARYEMKFFTHLATSWNRQLRSWDLFPEFLHLVYANRVLRESEIQEDEELATIPFPVHPQASEKKAA